MSRSSTHPLLHISHTYDASIKKLTVRGLSVFPEEILALAADIEILDLSYGALDKLPASFARLRQLKIVFLSHNNFTALPEILGSCPELIMIGAKSCRISSINPLALPVSLQALILTDNNLETLPASIASLKNLKKLTLTGNQLQDLPRELLACQQLELIRIAANQFSVLPDWLMQLPRLAWYSDAGNPGSSELSSFANRHPRISWSDITIHETLGESSKNIVYRGTLHTTQQEVAVKLYGNDITADGYSRDDIQASIAAGSHEHIITSIGELQHTPDDKPGLVMQRIPEEFKSLAYPPDFQTLTRDIYTPGRTYPLSFIVKLLKGTITATRHLHSRGIMHGDLYAHNILVNNSGYPYVGDFGASTIYDVSHGTQREHIDARAFAHLVDELMSHCQLDETRQHEHTVIQLKKLSISARSSSSARLLTDMYDIIVAL